VSRVGGSAQIKAMKTVAGRLRLDLAQYRELEAFAQFGSDLDAATQRQLARGARTVEVLKQPQYSPMAVEHQVMVIYAVTNGHLDEVPVERIQDWEAGFHAFMREQRPEVGQAIRQSGKLEEDTVEGLKAAIDEYNQRFQDSATVGAGGAAGATA
jgi:F-type H+-transporting ATPase subunit alpha